MERMARSAGPLPFGSGLRVLFEQSRSDLPSGDGEAAGAGPPPATELVGGDATDPQDEQQQKAMQALTERRHRSALTRGVTHAVKGKFNVAVAGVAATGAAFCQSWSMLLLAAAAYLAMVAWDLSSLDFWKRALNEDEDRPLPVPDMATLTDSTSVIAVQRIVDARTRLAIVLSETPEEVRLALGPALSRIRKLEEHAIVLLSRVDELGRYLTCSSPELVRAEIAHAERRLRHAREDDAREQYRQARDVRMEQLGALEEISANRERLAATLDHLLGTLEALPTRVVRLRMLHTQAGDPAAEDGAHEVTWLNDEVRRVEEAMRTVVGPPPSSGA